MRGNTTVPKKKTKEDPARQVADFRRVAQEIGADADRGADEVMERLAQQKKRRRRPESHTRKK
jgi:hypothetical protein